MFVRHDSSPFNSSLVYILGDSTTSVDMIKAKLTNSSAIESDNSN
nr:MAG TPA: hypothetical protein [Caudoviricetes sp.]